MFLEKRNIKQAFAPVDLNTAAVTGARVSLAHVKKVACVISVGTSLTGGVVDITLKQHNAASAGTSKDLLVAKKYYKKVGTATKFTEVPATVAAANYVLSTDFDTNGGIVVFEVDAADLDVNGGFTHFSVNLADGGVAKVGSAIYILSDNDFTPAYALDI
jgi:hypothetical protein